MTILSKKASQKVINLFGHFCPAKDSHNTLCNRKLTQQEFEQDGMCGHCADHIWDEMQTGKPWKVKPLVKKN